MAGKRHTILKRGGLLGHLTPFSRRLGQSAASDSTSTGPPALRPSRTQTKPVGAAAADRLRAKAGSRGSNPASSRSSPTAGRLLTLRERQPPRSLITRPLWTTYSTATGSLRARSWSRNFAAASRSSRLRCRGSSANSTPLAGRSVRSESANEGPLPEWTSWGTTPWRRGTSPRHVCGSPAR